jgi:ABC-type glycerol-3-phosphate transport system substrate-binding protein
MREMKIRRLCLLACVPLALGACGASDAAKETGEADSTSAPPTDTTATVVPLPPDSAPHDTMRVALAAVNASGITGDAVVSGSGSGAQVVLTLRGAKAAGTHQAHVHSGTCAQPGPPVAPLQPVTVDASGTGSSTSTIDVGMAALMDGGHIVSAHEAGGNPGAMIACGRIEAHPM